MSTGIRSRASIEQRAIAITNTMIVRGRRGAARRSHILTVLPGFYRVETAERARDHPGMLRAKPSSAKPREDRKYVAPPRRPSSPSYDHCVRNRDRSLLDPRSCAHAGRHFSEPEPPCDLRGAAVRGHVPGTDGRLPRLLLRISFPLHHGD